MKNSKNISQGSFAAAMIIIVTAIIIVLNLLVGQLPSSSLELDLSSKKLYSVSDISKDFIKDIDSDIEFILVGSEDNTDERITKFVNSYAALSDHITVQQIDPLTTPSVLDTYETSENTLVVHSKATGRNYSIDYVGENNCLIQYTMNPNSYSYVESAFDADGQITSAISYVTSEAQNKIYVTTGHGETELPVGFTDLIKKSNTEVSTTPVDLLMDEGIPEDCDLLVCYGPSTDITADEVEILETYLQCSGDIFLVINDYNLKNFNTLLRDYGLEMQNGIVGDSSRFYNQYYQNYGYYCISPVISAASDITSAISEEGTSVITFLPCGVRIVDPAQNNITDEAFMYTSKSSIITDSSNNNTEDGNSCIIGAVATANLPGNGIDAETTEGRLTVITSINFLSDSITQTFSSMGNLTIGINAVTRNFGEVKGISIPAKSLAVTYNSVPNFIMWAVITIGILPLLIVVSGLIIWNRRRKR